MSETFTLPLGKIDFYRSLECTPGMMLVAPHRDVRKDEWAPVALRAGRPQSGSSDACDVTATVPADCAAFGVHFTLCVLPSCVEPARSEGLEVRRGFGAFIERYAALNGFDALAERYVENLANGRFAWRSRCCDADRRVEVSWGDEQRKVVFDPQQFSLVYLGGRRMLVNALLSGAPEDVDDLIATIADALVGESAYIDVRYTETVEPGDTLLPATGRALSRRYQTVDDVSGGREIQALMIRNDAIQNALRWIDDWHGDPNFLCVTPVEPSMRHRPGGLRRDGVMAPDIAQIRRNPAPMLAELAQGAPGPIAHYLAANIVRGGQL